MTPFQKNHRQTSFNRHFKVNWAEWLRGVSKQKCRTFLFQHLTAHAMTCWWPILDAGLLKKSVVQHYPTPPRNFVILFLPFGNTMSVFVAFVCSMSLTSFVTALVLAIIWLALRVKLKLNFLQAAQCLLTPVCVAPHVDVLKLLPGPKKIWPLPMGKINSSNIKICFFGTSSPKAIHYIFNKL